MNAKWRWLAGFSAIAFGLATVIEGGHVLLGGPAARAEAGRVVPFVLDFNFGAGFAYVLSGAATVSKRRWAAWPAMALALTTLLVFAAFGVHVLWGGEYERRTVLAMSFRSLFWLAQAIGLSATARPRRAHPAGERPQQASASAAANTSIR